MGRQPGLMLRRLLVAALAAADDRQTIKYFVHKYNGLAPWLDWGGLPCRNSTRTCAGAPPRVAFLVAGASRGFVERPDVHGSYKRFVVDSFAAAGDSEVLLYLRGVGNVTAAQWAALDAALGPSVVARVPDNDTAADPPPLAPAARDCVAGTGFARDDYRRRAHAWWSSMAAGHALVVGRERATGKRFDVVVFSRPDVLYDFPFGPHCEYDAGTWYAGGKGAPDNFWILPRAAAASVLNSLASFYACAGPTEPCCVRTHRDVSGATMFSWWITYYWHVAARRVFPLSTRLKGSATVAVTHNRGAGSHLGCGAPNCGTMCPRDRRRRRP